MNTMKAYRQQAGLTLTELAYKMGLAYSTVTNIENGLIRSYPKFRRKAAEALSTTESAIFDEKGWILPYEPQAAA
jgi:transcriptional regulator with XRE-family HTH domain